MDASLVGIAEGIELAVSDGEAEIDGASLGICDSVGTKEIEGTSLGPVLLVGVAVGSSLGIAVGTTDREGAVLGWVLLVGRADGTSEGLGLGKLDNVGNHDGELLGASRPGEDAGPFDGMRVGKGESMGLWLNVG